MIEQYLYSKKKDGNVSLSRTEQRLHKKALNDIKFKASKEYVQVFKYLTESEIDSLEKHYTRWFKTHRFKDYQLILIDFAYLSVISYTRKEAIERKIKIENLCL